MSMAHECDMDHPIVARNYDKVLCSGPVTVEVPSRIFQQTRERERSLPVYSCITYKGIAVRYMASTEFEVVFHDPLTLSRIFISRFCANICSDASMTWRDSGATGIMDRRLTEKRELLVPPSAQSQLKGISGK